ncbi:MAG: peptidase U32 family protein [Eggerthellaceae bacterium]|nr:peptidase U32 family protein [Eggerthellaceae bacterium]
MELLAPAGGMEQLRAAVRFGADAVYLAADRFGMRARAANFALADIPEAVAFAHAAGVKVHVTCNVLMTPDDIDALPAYLRALDAAGVDALIIGDMGAFALAREHAPHVDLHVSTQASVANAAAARVWHALGARRVVCAREMSLADIARLRQDAPPDLEIEAFAHGAMCMAVSGRCLISSYLTGRSGNKGHCTQPCRWSYTLGELAEGGEDMGACDADSGACGAASGGTRLVLEEEKRPGEFFPIEQDGRGTFIMNAKDLCMIEHLDALAAAGVDSIKIEGRNKKAFYVACVVGAYRRALDGAPIPEVLPEVYAVSHRPYGTGFYFGEAEQAPAYDGYEQETMHVADVVEGGEADAFSIVARCRNRFAEGDELEVLAPHAPVRALRVRNLTWLPDPTDDDPAPAPVPVPVANRSCNRYRFEAEWVREGAPAKSDTTAENEAFAEGGALASGSAPAPSFAVPAGSFLRVRKFRRSARHG